MPVTSIGSPRAGDGTFSVDFKKIKQAVMDLDREFRGKLSMGSRLRGNDGFEMSGASARCRSR
jgi:hypothetical protein